MPDPTFYWRLLPLAYLLTVALELPVLLVGLSRQHPWPRRLFAAFWLTACTYPLVGVAMPLAFDIGASDARHLAYIIVAETFAPLAECLLFAAAFHHRGMARGDRWRDFIAIVLANFFSFGVGLLIPLGE
jgi:hypothetical protein